MKKEITRGVEKVYSDLRFVLADIHEQRNYITANPSPDTAYRKGIEKDAEDINELEYLEDRIKSFIREY